MGGVMELFDGHPSK